MIIFGVGRGARYYDSRIANWTSIDPLFEKHFDYTPYYYVLRSPLILYDPDGKQNYIFNESGKYVTTEESESASLTIENSGTKERQSYEFNDPKKDAVDILELINTYDPSTKLVCVKTKTDIRLFMENAGVNEWYLTGATGEMFALINPPDRGNEEEPALLDFFMSNLVPEMKKIGIKRETYSNDKGVFFIFPGKNIAYNPMDAGNFLWGLSAKHLGISLNGAKAGANAYSYYDKLVPDSEFDQKAIKEGWEDSGGIKP